MSFAAYVNQLGSGVEERTFWSELFWGIPEEEKEKFKNSKKSVRF